MRWFPNSIIFVLGGGVGAVFGGGLARRKKAETRLMGGGGTRCTCLTVQGWGNVRGK